MSYKYNDDGVKEYLQKEYVQKYYKDLFFGLLDKAYEDGLISHNELFVKYVSNKKDISSFYVMTLSILADSIEDVYYDMTDVYNSSKVLYAIGKDLDDIGALVGCPRPQATKSSVLLRFRMGKRYDYPIMIDKPIDVFYNNRIKYTTVETVLVPTGEVEFEAYALSEITGATSRVTANTLTEIDTEIIMENGEALPLSVTNPESSTGGMEAYSDDEYRELLMDWVKSKIKGSNEAYENYFARMDGLDSYKLIPNWNGVTGTLKIVLDPGYPYQLKQAYDDINYGVSQFSEDVTLHPPKYVPINVYAYVDVDIDRINPYSTTEKEEIKAKIEEAVRVFIDGDLYNKDNRKIYNGLEIGEDFIPYKLGVFISNAIPEVKNISFNYPRNPVTITDEELGKSNEITIEMTTAPTVSGIDVDGDDVIDYVGWKINNS